MDQHNRDDTASRNIQLLEQYLSAINAWDFDTMAGLLHPDITYELPYAPPPFPRTTSGHEAVMRFLRSVPDFAEAENLHAIRIDALASNPGELIAEYRSDMKLVNGGSYNNSYIVRVSCDGLKIRRFTEYFDPLPLIEAVGGNLVTGTSG